MRKIVIASLLSTVSVVVGCVGTPRDESHDVVIGDPITLDADSLPADANTADVQFLAQMVSHCTKVLEVIDAYMNEEPASNATGQLAYRLRVTHDNELTLMKDLAQKWGQNVALTYHGQQNSDDVAGPEQIQTLRSLLGVERDGYFLELIYALHEASFPIVLAELNHGSQRAAVGMAEDMQASFASEQRSVVALLGYTPGGNSPS